MLLPSGASGAGVLGEQDAGAPRVELLLHQHAHEGHQCNIIAVAQVLDRSRLPQRRPHTLN